MHILFVSGLGGDTRRYRCAHHQQQLALHGITSVLCEADEARLYAEAAACDLVILHRVAWSPRIRDVVELAHSRGLPAVFETDDLIFAPELYDRIAFLDTLTPDAAQRFRADLVGQAQTFARCDCVLTSTEYLAEAAARRGKPAYVQRNAASAEMVAAAEGAYALRQARLADAKAGETPALQSPVVIGYFSGTGSHNRDFSVVAPVLAELMGVYPHLWLHISGHLEIGGALLAYTDGIRRAPFVDWRELPNLVAQIDINLAPLELDNPFCQAKSEIKYSEAALVGVPTVASPTQAYAYAVEDGRTGFLAATPDEWRRALIRLIEQPQVREQMGETARRAVYAAYLPEKAGEALVAVLNTIRQRHAPPPAEPEATLQLLAERAVAQMENQAAELAQVTRQAEQLRQLLARWEGAGRREDTEFWRAGLLANQERQQAVLREILLRLEQQGAGGRA